MPAAAATALTDPVPLSFAQERLWFFDRLYGRNAVYNEPVVLHLRGKLDKRALAVALNGLVARHESLRTTYADGEAGPRQLVSAPAPVPLAEFDLRFIAEEEREGEWLRLAAAFALEPFDLRTDLMTRAALFAWADDVYRLLTVTHHIATDGWSVGIMNRELSALYNAAREGRPSPLEPLPLQYKDYAFWQRTGSQGAGAAAGQAYWQKKLEGVQELSLPQAHTATDNPEAYAGEALHLLIPPSLHEPLRALAREERATLYMLLLAAFNVLLYRYTGQEDITIGSPVAGRPQSELQELIGFFVNMLVLRTDLSGDPSFRELFQRVRATVLEALQYQDVPYAELIEMLQPERHISRNPLFDVAFQVVHSAGNHLDFAGLEAARERVNFGTAKFDLDVAIIASAGEWTMRWTYKTALFDQQTVQRMHNHFVQLLRSIVANPQHPLDLLPILPAQEKAWLFEQWTAARAPYEDQQTIQDLFVGQVGKRPREIAVTFARETLTYEQLNARANRLGHYLLQNGVRPGELVGLALDRSLDLITAMLAILKAGAAYLPLDTDYPQERLNLMLEDSRCRLVLTHSAQRERIAWGEIEAISLDAPRVAAALAALPAHNPQLAAQVQPLSPAYTIFTSGSTGRPKGVIVPHRAVLRLVRNANYARLDAQQHFVQFASVSFDAATLEIWGPLLNGGQLHIYPPGPAGPRELARFLRDKRVSYLFLTTGLFHQMVDHALETLAGIAQVQAGGDVVSPAHVRRLLEVGGPCEFAVVYGPTENTTFSTYQPIRDAAECAERLPIGRPISNSTLCVLDANLQPVPIGIPGELYLGGDGLALGYLGRPRLTAERFIRDPFSDDPQAKLYRTGDLARTLPGGEIDFLGRLDRQVKVRGFRVEPGEIESRLAAYAPVRQAVVVARATGAADKQLVAYVVLEENETLDQARLLHHLAGHLPDYMIPAAVIQLAEMPLDPNGKIDRAALPEPSFEPRAGAEAISVPQTEQEKALAAIWQEVLDLQTVDVHSSFFAAGGHSLLGVRLFALIEDRLGVRLPLTLLFQSPTIAQLAAALDQATEQASDTLLVPLRAAGNRPPLFLIHGVYGDLLAFSHMVPAMAAGQSIYGFQAAGLNPAQEQDQSIEQMASRYVAALRAFQPRGPYHLGGYCFGGVVAYEMARQLAAEGAQVAALIIIEGSTPKRFHERVPLIHPLRLQTVAQALPYWLNGRARDGAGQTARRGSGGTRAAPETAPRLAGQANLDAEFDNLADMLVEERPLVQNQLRAQYTQMLAAYTPHAYPGKVTLIRARAARPRRILLRPFDPRRGWGRVAAGGVDIRFVNGSHLSILGEENAAQLARVVTEALPASSATVNKV